MIKQRRPSRNYKPRRSMRARRQTQLTSSNNGMLRSRLVLVMAVLLFAVGAIGGRLAWVATVPAPEHHSRSASAAKPIRGDITDRDGRLLATTVTVPSLYADPKYVLDARQTVRKLKQVLPSVKSKELLARLQQPGRRFVWVDRQLTPAQAQAVNNLGLPGIYFRDEQVRLYPQGSLFSHLLGGASVDGRGLAGIEAGMNQTLSKGETIELTVDSRLQQALHSTLAETIESTNANAAWGVVMDPWTGDIIAAASLPDYNPHQLGSAAKDARRNRFSHGSYEMGSTFKMLTAALAMEQNAFEPDSVIDCTDPIKIAGFTIRDYKPKARPLTLTEVLRYSSNIGVAQVGDALGSQALQDFFGQLHLLDTPNLPLPEVAQSQYPQTQWGRVHAMTMSFGHGIAITPVQLAAAYSALVTDGHYRQPVFDAADRYREEVPVISADTIEKLKGLMANVVAEGSGRGARIAGMPIGGKTGTAQKQVNGKYIKGKNVVSFIGAAPLDNPQLVALIMVDEPKKGRALGGAVAAPAFKKFMQRAMPVLALAPQPEQPKTQLAKRKAPLAERTKPTTVLANAPITTATTAHR